MTTFNPGTGGTLNSTTVEAAFMEACQLLQNEERAIEELTNNIAVNYFTGDNVVQVSGTFPLVQSVDVTTGKSSFSTSEFITTTFANGGGDLKSTNLPNAVLELALTLQVLEKTQADAPNNVQITYDTEAELITIAAENPIEFSLNTDGSAKISAIPYLA
ncbi:MAG: hypothetical protein QNJ47_23925 [Nostocaceae cyanobacterium]|nr:hypothetical protein [Nostocaceae cyanobacterium]